MADISKVEIGGVSYNVKDAIARKMIEELPSGGGGGGGASSWKDLGEGFGEGVLLEETTLTEQSTQIDKELGLVAEAVYTINWNGTEYTPTAVDASAMVGVTGAVVLGMSSKYPFTILAKPGNGVSISIDSGSAPVTVSITGLGNTIIPIPGKYLPKGTPWIEESADAELFPETTVQFNEGYETSIVGTIPMSAGETYTVKWNGTEYSCVALDVSAVLEGVPAVGIGNGEAFGMPGNGEPFIIVSIPSYGVITLMGVGGDSEAVFSVRGKGEAIHKVDERCLPEGYPYVEGKVVELFSGHTTSDNSSESLPSALGLIAGQTYTVYWDGVAYKRTAQSTSIEGMAAVYVGNPEFVLGGTDSGDPFCVVDITGIGSMVAHDTSASGHTVSMIGYVETVHKMDRKYLDFSYFDGLTPITVCNESNPLELFDHSSSFIPKEAVMPLIESGIVPVSFAYRIGDTVYSKKMYLIGAGDSAYGLFADGKFMIAAILEVKSNGTVFFSLTPVMSNNTLTGIAPAGYRSPVVDGDDGKIFAIVVDDTGSITTKEVT